MSPGFLAGSIPLRKVGGLWHDLAINKGQTESGVAHKDYKDAKESFNCVQKTNKRSNNQYPVRS